MKLSTRTRYGLRLMSTLASTNGDKPVLLKDIAANEEISEKYLSLIVISLRAAGLIRSFRGARGGYALAKYPNEISLHNIITALEGEICLVHCTKQPSSCRRSTICPAHDIWKILGNKISETLASITLADLAQIKKEKATKTAHINKIRN